MRQQVKHAVIKEQNVIFALVQVRDGVVESQATAVSLINTLSSWYRCPVVLMGARYGRLNGRGDLVNFLSSLKPSQIPWREEMLDYTEPQSESQPQPSAPENPPDQRRCTPANAQGTRRRLSAIVSADVVGYSRLMGADEVGTLAAMKSHRSELWDPMIEKFGGRVVGTAGDSLLIEYASAVAAVESSVAIQRAMIERNADLPQERRMELRIGINIGEVIVDDDDIFGDCVNVAARLQAIADSGCITVSGSIQEQVNGKLDVAFNDDGEHEVKNIDRPVQVWRWSPIEVSLSI